MDAEFWASLVAAVSMSIAESAIGAELKDDSVGQSSPWARLADEPVTLAVEQHSGIQGIRESDPDFDLQAYLLRVGEMFSAYHEAIDRGDLSPARRFMDEAAYARLEPIVDRAGRRPGGPRALRIRAVRPMTAKHDEELDLVRVFITAEETGTRTEEGLRPYVMDFGLALSSGVYRGHD